MPPIEVAAIPSDQRAGAHCELRAARGGEFPDQLQRRDAAIGKTLQEGVLTNEINGGRFRLAPSGIRKKR